ncbi:MAG: glycosyltransferase family 2 protein [Parcubacteria group bacterium]|jgi:glycosyltransferase involved in cell wall biosynthesis
MIKNKNISIIIPAYNEADNLGLLFEEIQNVMMKGGGNKYEVIIINDGSTDNTEEIIKKLHNKYPENIIGVNLCANCGKAVALNTGFKIAKGDIVFTMDADLQDDPKEIPRFIKKIEEGFDCISGWKKDRKDTFIKNKTSKIYNYATQKASGLKLHDFNCGFKAYRKEYIKKINIYGELHRYIPVILKTYGCRITEIEVNHRKRKFGKTKYGIDRFIKGFLDLFTVIFITRYNARPLHLFGLFGMMSFSLGCAAGLYLLAIRIVTGSLLTHEPLLISSVMLVILGMQTMFTGLLSEQIVNTTNRQNQDDPIRNILK